MIKVFKRGCRFSSSARREVELEIRRGTDYYNAMMSEMNLRLAGPPKHRREELELAGLPVPEGIAQRIERLVKRWSGEQPDNPKAKALIARVIYGQVAKIARDIRRNPKYSAAASGCYTGTYHQVQADFDRAVAAKRPGVWPGAPYRLRRYDGPGACVGVHLQPSKPWAWVLAGKSSMASAGEGDGRIFPMRLKVSKSATIELTVDRGKKCRGERLQIPQDALVSHVMVHRAGDYATGGKYEIHITYKTEEELPVLAGTKIGVDIGWRAQPDGGLLVAVASNGLTCTIPAYAVRMALRPTEIAAERGDLMKAAKLRLLEKGLVCRSDVPNGVVDFCERHAPEWMAEYLEADHVLHCRQDHVRRRAMNIRKDVFRKFANQLRGLAAIQKRNLKAVAEGELKDTAANETRAYAANFELYQIMKGVGAVEVAGNDLTGLEGAGFTPILEKARAIGEAATRGDLKEVVARKALRMYRKGKKKEA